MKRWTVAICVFVPLFSSCGVNPERAKDLRISDRGSLSDQALVKDDNDPQEIKDAIDSLDELSLAIENLDFVGIQKLRAGISAPFEKLPNNFEKSASPKITLIHEKLNALDQLLAEKMGTHGTPFLDPSREYDASPDAIKAFAEGISICETINEMKTTVDVDSRAQNMNQAFETAVRLDKKVARYKGDNGRGTFVDHPFIFSLCRYKVAARSIEIGDLEPVFSDRSSVYVGCGTFELDVGADTSPKGLIGPFMLTTRAAFAETAPAPERVECAIIPSRSDAPSYISSLIKSNVQWLQPNDILSMKNKTQLKSGRVEGRVSVFRRDAEIRTNACGAKDSVIVCSPSGNPVSISFDLGTHFIQRANVHRANGRTEGCKRMASKAVEFTSKKLDYDGKLIYQTNKDKRLQPSEIKEKIEAMKTEASTMLSSDWCQLKPHNIK